MTAASDHVNLRLGGRYHADWPFGSHGAEWLQEGYMHPEKQKANPGGLA
jgi:hypothetical protein